ncbi:MAG: hypothetical protein UW03_C0015G0059 [Candidatus Peregrinibacteria bacterium GW2011_GWA2_43_8]|nr:MAG: hypothetical protein UW03_C0015G0059 [Candidatus Peregrinibacteria bacterium GW2011_GWA2_43_8]
MSQYIGVVLNERLWILGLLSLGGFGVFCKVCFVAEITYSQVDVLPGLRYD